MPLVSEGVVSLGWHCPLSHSLTPRKQTENLTRLKVQIPFSLCALNIFNKHGHWLWEREEKTSSLISP